MAQDTSSETLAEYERVVAGLLTHANTAALERTARLLASYVGHYQLRHGIISAADIASINNMTPSETELIARIEALRVLAAALSVAEFVDAAGPES